MANFTKVNYPKKVQIERIFQLEYTKGYPQPLAELLAIKHTR